MGTCSRCKVIRKAGVTDRLLTDLENFKTCESCRDKLKHYRRKHVDKRRKIATDKKNTTDDQVNVNVALKRRNKKKNISKSKYVIFGLLLEKIYNDAKIEDINIDETVQIDEFTLPKIFSSTNKHENLGAEDDNEFYEINPDNVDTDEDDDSKLISDKVENMQSLKSTYLLSLQTEKDEHLKNELIESFEVHYINRIRHILKLCDLEFKFYVSSWKNGKYYTTFKCSQDKLALKRFGIDVNQVDLIHDSSPNSGKGDGNSVLKSKLMDWVGSNDDAHIDPVVDLNLNIENLPVNSKFYNTFGYYCDSKLSFIVDYTKLEFNIKCVHKCHSMELKHLDEKRINNTQHNPKPEILKKKNDNPIIFEQEKKEDLVSKNNEKEAKSLSVGNLSAKLNKLHEALEL